MDWLNGLFGNNNNSNNALSFGGATPIGNMGSNAEFNSFDMGNFDNIGNASFNSLQGNNNLDSDSFNWFGKDGVMGGIGQGINAGASLFGAYNAYNKNQLLEDSMNYNMMSGDRDYASRAQSYNNRRMDQLRDAGKSQEYIDANYNPVAKS